ncbi:hypothetical protein Vretimale_2290 [Volvox reticuliferus]|uniref:Uncharacterized protein n=1 Tax=Volvox reticuliferus TaxID=1737510 RepID=A0A8J4D7F6_9CHLO|nr:hypothetical protein Vretifemale_4539 [Volvox reticuliferus]GIL96496.1 hypothetical protein Vretimale_2290 [Volvox reticuliferus]
MELAFTGGFAWAAWQILGRLQKHVSKVEKNIDDGRLLGDWDNECKAQVAKKQRASAAMGQGATASHHDHIFEDWRNKKLRPAQITQLVSDLAELAQWAGAGSWVPELRGDQPVKPWTEYGAGGKVHLLQAADTLNFNFAEIVKRNAEDLAGNWLWQVTEALPALSAEPVRSAGPNERLGDLKTRLADAEAAVRAALDSERRSQATSLKGLVQPLAVAACMRKLQMLKVLSEDVGLTASASAAAAERIRTELKAPLTLAAVDPEVADQKVAAEAAIAEAANAAVATERETRMAQIEAAAAATYRRVLTLQASSPTHWHAASTTPALNRLGLLAALLAELACCDSAGTQAGSAAAAELADAVRKLTPQMRVVLSEEQKARETELLAALTPAPPAPAVAVVEPVADAAVDAKGDDEAEGEGEGEGDSKEPATEAAAVPSPSPPQPPARPAPGAAAVELRSLLDAAIRKQLEDARAERKAARAAELAATKAAAARAAAAEAAAKASAAASETRTPEGPAAVKLAAAVETAADGDKPETEKGDVEDDVEETGEEEAAGPSADATAESEGDSGKAAAEPQKDEGMKDEDAEDEKLKDEEAKDEAAEAEAEEDIEAEGKEGAAAGNKAVEATMEDEAPKVPAVPPPAEPEATVAKEEAEQKMPEETEEEEEEEEGPTAEESVDVDAVRRAVEAEARARADAEKEGAVAKLQDALDALRTSTSVQALKALVEKVSVADGAADAPDVGARLLAIESLFHAAVAAPTDNALATAVAAVSVKLTAADRAALDAVSVVAIGRLEAAAALIKLTTDVGKLDMGPGCADILRRTDAWLAQQQKAVVAAAERATERAAKAAAKAEAASAKAVEEEAAAARAALAKAEGEGEVAAVENGAEEAEERGKEDKEAEDVKAEDLEEAKEEEEEASPAVDPVRLAEGRQLVSELLAEGLVLLELPSPSNKKLQLLRESVDALDPVDGDGIVQNRLITTLKDVVGQLGPIGGSVDARLSQVLEEAERERLLQVRANAMAIYSALTAFLRLETEIWESVKADLEKAKKALYGVKIERRAESLAAGQEACGDISERCAAFARVVLGLSSPAGKEAAVRAKAALQSTAEQAQTLSSALNDYISYVRLREHALGIPITAKADMDEDCELSLPTMDAMTARHGNEAVWLDLAGLDLNQPGDEEEGSEDVDIQAKEAAQEKAVEELQQRLNDWHTAGLKLLSRGQAALVTLGGSTVDGSSSGELRLTADIGLPSAKSLLQLGAEKLARLQLLAAESVSGPNSGVAYPLNWYLLVPSASVGPLKAFLEENEYFGMLPSQVHVYGNEVRPPLMNEDFKVVLDSSGCRTARSQPGSGEVFLALRRCGALSHMRRMGIRCLEVDAVEDNLLGRPLDPAFLGACAATAIDSAAKVAVPGVQAEGPCALPELYSRYLELLGGSSPLLQALGDAVPALGSYYFSMDFVRRVDKLLREEPLALYRLAPADKVPTRGSAAAAAAAAAKPGTAAAGAPAAPAPGGGVTGYRLERRLSDFASPAIGRLLGNGVHLAMVAVDVGTEFAPVWGTAPFYRVASPRAAVDALLLQHTRWVEDSGGGMADEDGVVEISPLVSYAGEGLAPLVEDKTFEEAYVLELQGFSAESTGNASNMGPWAVPALVLYSGVAAAKLLAKVTHK